MQIEKLTRAFILFLSLLVSPVAALSATYVVDDASDDVEPQGLTLRSAISLVNMDPGPHVIQFNIPGSGVRTITLESALPLIEEAVTIDGTTQPSYSGTPLIELDGSAASGDGLGFSGTGAIGSVVKGLIINNFSNYGISVDSANAVEIYGSWIGLDADGETAAPNGSAGISISNSFGVKIGGSDPSLRNVISGNSQLGIAIFDPASTESTIAGNYIGTNSSGNAAVPNFSNSLFIGSAGNLIDGNVIAGSDPLQETLGGASLIYISTGASGNIFINNKIGTNAAGTASLTDENKTYGFSVLAGGNVIGQPGAGNLISGTAVPIQIAPFDAGSPVNGTIIQSNRIGTDINGTSAIPNGFGVFLNASAGGVENTLIGVSSSVGEGNIISGNVGPGVLILGTAASGNVVRGNLIGTQADGLTALPNSGSGVSIVDSSGNQIGGTGEGEGNVIAFNGGLSSHGGGVTVLSGTGNRISGNSIFSNVGLGIDLLLPTPDSLLPMESSPLSGVTLNDPDDSDTGSNNLQNFPEISAVAVSKSDTRVTGVIRGAPGSSLTIEFFANSSIDPTGYGEGARFLGSDSVIIAANGVGKIDSTIPQLLQAGESVSATATDSLANTSEFSASILPPKVVTGKTKIDLPPGVEVIDDDVIITLQIFTPPKAKGNKNNKNKNNKNKNGKNKNGKNKNKKPASLTFTASARKPAAKAGGRGKVQYQVMLKNTDTGKVQRRTTKKTTLTISNLAAGNYSVTYNARLVKGGQVVSKTRQSPSASFSVGS